MTASCAARPIGNGTSFALYDGGVAVVVVDIPSPIRASNRIEGLPGG